MTVEHPSTVSSTPETADHALEEELQAEHGLGRAIIIGVLVAVPINVGVWVGLIAFAVSRAGSSVHLSAKEFDLLAYFLRHPGQVLSREQILNGVWDYGHDPGTNIVEVYVGYLRRKLALADSPAPIETVRSVGYRLRDD